MRRFGILSSFDDKVVLGRQENTPYNHGRGGTLGEQTEQPYKLLYIKGISLTRGSFSCHQSLVLPRLMVRYSSWGGSLGVIFMAPNFTHSIFDPLSCTGTQWIGDKVMINESLHSPHFPDILASYLPLDCC